MRNTHTNNIQRSVDDRKIDLLYYDYQDRKKANEELQASLDKVIY